MGGGGGVVFGSKLGASKPSILLGAKVCDPTQSIDLKRVLIGIKC